MRGRLRIGDDQVVELAEMFRLMSDPTRLRIILACLDAPAAVGEMAERLGDRLRHIHLTDGNGLDVTRAIRADPVRGSTPVVHVSAVARDPRMSRALARDKISGGRF